MYVKKGEKAPFSGNLLSKKEINYYKNLEKKVTEILEYFDKMNLKNNEVILYRDNKYT